MFCSRSLNTLINRIHECALRLTHNDYISTFQDILEMTKEKTLHQNNLESLAKSILISAYAASVLELTLNKVNK